MKERKVSEHLKEQLQNAHFKEIYELEEQKYAIIRKIIDYRVQYNLSQGQLAEQVGVSQQHISKIENAEFSNVATLEKVLHAIGYAIKMTVIRMGEPRRADKLALTKG